MVERLTNLIAIFENPALDFSKNRAENDDILGDAYEYLMRHFATESGKSKGQFYTPSEVSRIIAKVIGISPRQHHAATTAYDPTCGSGSLLLKVAAEAGKHITLEGQEKDVTTAGLARMNMILHDFPTANIKPGNTLASPPSRTASAPHLRLRRRQSALLRQALVHRPRCRARPLAALPALRRAARGSRATTPTSCTSSARMKSTGKGACILPHGVLFRGNAEAVIRQQLVRSGYLKGIIGLPANLFYGTGIPACIVVLDKENATARKGIFMIDASKGFMKDGTKNRLREQDIHKIVDTFTRQVEIAALLPHGAGRGNQRPEERLQPQPPALHRQHRAGGLAGHRRPPARRHSRSATSMRSTATGRSSPACAPPCSRRPTAPATAS